MNLACALLRRVSSVRGLGLGSFPTPGLLPFAALLWLGLYVAMVALTFAIDRWGTVDTSVWEQASQPIRWGLLFIGVWVVQTYLATYVAHGITRRSFGERTAGLAVALAALVAALSTLGFVIEGWIYDVKDWSQAIADEHLFDSADDLPQIFGTYFLVFLLWFAVGVLNGVAFYRNDGEWSFISIPVTIVVVAASEAAIDGAYPEVITRVVGFLDDVAAPVGVAVWAACLAAAVAMTWGLLRDVPIKPKGS